MNIKRALVRIAPLFLIISLLTLPAQAYTATTLDECKEIFVFESGIIDVDWESYETLKIENGVIMGGQTKTEYTPTVKIPLGSKVKLTQKAINQGYKIVVAKNNQSLKDEVTSYVFNSTESLLIGIYKSKRADGSMVLDYSLNVIGMKNGVVANLDTPFTDIGYFGEHYHVRGLYGKVFNVATPDELIKDMEWLFTQGITAGTSATTFSPYDTVTRAQMVQFLWNYNGKPEPKYSGNPFKDVKETDWFYKAVMWAYENNVTNGISETEFAPYKPCTDKQGVKLIGNSFKCELPNEIYDGRSIIQGTQTSFACSRINMAHYFHYAYEYASSQNSNV